MQLKSHLMVSRVSLITAVLIASNAIAVQFGGAGVGFEARVQGLTTALTTIFLPAVSVIGLVWAAVQAAMGNEGAKGKMALIIVASIIGFLAPILISWFKAAVGG